MFCKKLIPKHPLCHFSLFLLDNSRAREKTANRNVFTHSTMVHRKSSDLNFAADSKLRAFISLQIFKVQSCGMLSSVRAANLAVGCRWPTSLVPVTRITLWQRTMKYLLGAGRNPFLTFMTYQQCFKTGVRAQTFLIFVHLC